MKNGILVLMLTIFATGHASEFYRNGSIETPICARDRACIHAMIEDNSMAAVEAELEGIKNGSEVALVINQGTYEALRRTFLREHKGLYYIHRIMDEVRKEEIVEGPNR